MTPRRLPQVEPITGEFGCYLVQSSSRLGIRHRVDLMEYNGNGACGCEDFDFRVRPQLEKGAAPGVTLECRHIHLARHYSAVELWMTFAKRRKEAEKVRKLERKRHADHDEIEEGLPPRTEEEGALDKPTGGKRVYWLR